MRERDDVPPMGVNEMVYKNIKDTLLGVMAFVTAGYITGGVENAKKIGIFGVAAGLTYTFGAAIGQTVKELFPTDNGNNDNIVSSSASLVGVVAATAFTSLPVSAATVAGAGFAGGYVMETVVRPYMQAAFPQVRDVNHQGRVVGVEQQRNR